MAGIVVGYGFDGRSHAGRVLRQVSLAGQNVSGMTKQGTGRGHRTGSATRVGNTQVEIDAPGGGSDDEREDWAVTPTPVGDRSTA